MKALSAVLVAVLVLSTVAGAAAPGAAPVSDGTGSAPVLDSDSAAGAPAANAPAPAQVGVPATQLASNETASNATLHVLGIPPDRVNRSSLEGRSVDLGPALAFEDNETKLTVETLAAVERIRSTDTEDRRQQVILQELTTIEQRIISLRSRQQAAISAYGAGEITPRRFLVRLAVIDLEARALDERRQRIDAFAESIPDFSVESRSATLERELDTFTGPVRQHAVSVLQGDAEHARFFLQTGPDSVVAATVRNETYVREAYRGDLRARGTGVITLDEALDNTTQAYPYISALGLRESGTSVTGTRQGDNSVLVRIQHERGQLYAFVDSGSKEVFKEFQYRPLDTLRTTSTDGAVKDGLELTAHQTYAGGPVRIQLNRTDADRPVNARITVGPQNGQSAVVGETGDDGTLWTMAPGQTYQVTAIRGNSVVVLTVQPDTPPLVNQTGAGGPENATASQSPRSPSDA
ncbi:DUF7096 domain-containing protein [Halogeometricum luteum]|uniref:Uncharacterized protein n=1 Tax=Halogeometricum luteum TaxID=2950537 RepID=A0ABU2G6T0_9EURY|nr:hypothetical protein [Halogeometricum sp. S3BR5-2]MDS0296491.1 hypothetical protein [Halogeometricum sp. S3BR5-2]